MFGKNLWRLWMPLYLGLVAGVGAGMWYGRQKALDLYGTPAAEKEWRDWVEATRKHEGEGPVKRRVPESPQPPALILMKDYFGVCLAGALLLSSALYWTFAFMLQGAFFVRTGKQTPRARRESNHNGA